MYGGCDGNENNFEDIEDCQNTCESKSNLLEVYIYMCVYFNGRYLNGYHSARFVLANCTSLYCGMFLLKILIINACQIH